MSNRVQVGRSGNNQKICKKKLKKGPTKPAICCSTRCERKNASNRDDCELHFFVNVLFAEIHVAEVLFHVKQDFSVSFTLDQTLGGSFKTQNHALQNQNEPVESNKH